MSMALKEIKNRIKAANNIRQITKAMKLIASIKLKKIQKTFFPFKTYLSSIKEILNLLLRNHDFLIMMNSLEYFKERNADKKIVVIISSDKGLCGAYNTNLFNFFEKKYNKNKVKLITVGKKAYFYFSKRNYTILGNFEKIPDVPTFEFCRKINEFVISAYKDNKDANSVEVVYTKFINSIRYQPDVEKVLPLLNLKSDDKEKIEKTVDHFLFEPSLEVIGNYIIELYVDSLIYKLLVEAKLSEFSARFSAMNTATDNAEKLIKDLKLLFFKQRQESITKELLEISAGVEALK